MRSRAIGYRSLAIAKLHGMMMNKLMQMQAAGQHTDTEATSIPAVVAQTQKEGLERTAPSIQAKLTVSTPGDKYESKKKNKKLFRPK